MPSWRLWPGGVPLHRQSPDGYGPWPDRAAQPGACRPGFPRRADETKHHAPAPLPAWRTQIQWGIGRHSWPTSYARMARKSSTTRCMGLTRTRQKESNCPIMRIPPLAKPRCHRADRPFHRAGRPDRSRLSPSLPRLGRLGRLNLTHPAPSPPRAVAHPGPADARTCAAA